MFRSIFHKKTEIGFLQKRKVHISVSLFTGIREVSDLGVGLSRFCFEKAKTLLRNMPKKLLKIEKVAKIFLKLLEYHEGSMSNINNNCFIINIEMQLSN